MTRAVTARVKYPGLLKKINFYPRNRYQDLVIVVVIVDSGIVGKIKHQIGR